MVFRVGAAVAASAAAATIALVPVAVSAPSRAASARLGAEWLAGRQQSNGSFTQAGRADLTGDVLAAIVAGGVDGKIVSRALGYIAKNGEDDATRPAYTGRIVAGIVAGGGDPTGHGGTDFVAKLDAAYNPVTGSYETEQLFPNLLAANGVLAAKEDLPARAVDYIEANACPGGGFSFENACGKGADTDTTSWAINVLVAAGAKNDAEVTAARSFLLSSQRSDGGWAFSEGGNLPTSADSTGLALSAIAALGENARRAPWRQSDGDDPVSALAKLQQSSGGFRPAAGQKPNTMSTTNAVTGMAEEAFPVEYRAPSKPSDDPSTEAGDDDDAAAADGDASGDDDPDAKDPSTGGTASDGAPTPSPEPTDDLGLTAPGREDADGDASSGRAQSFDRPKEKTSDDPGGFPWLAIPGALVGFGASGAGFWLLRRQPTP